MKKEKGFLYFISKKLGFNNENVNKSLLMDDNWIEIHLSDANSSFVYTFKLNCDELTINRSQEIKIENQTEMLSKIQESNFENFYFQCFLDDWVLLSKNSSFKYEPKTQFFDEKNKDKIPLDFIIEFSANKHLYKEYTHYHDNVLVINDNATYYYPNDKFKKLIKKIKIEYLLFEENKYENYNDDDLNFLVEKCFFLDDEKFEEVGKCIVLDSNGRFTDESKELILINFSI